MGPPLLLMQRDDYVIRSLNVHDGAEQWNVSLSEVFAIATHPTTPSPRPPRPSKPSPVSPLTPADRLLAHATNAQVHYTTRHRIWPKTEPRADLVVFVVGCV